MQKYKKGDRVKVKYGHIIWQNKKSDDFVKFKGTNWKLIEENDGVCWWDMSPELTEDIATIIGSYYDLYPTGYGATIEKFGDYSLNFDKYGEMSWFSEDQLILEINES